MWRTPGHCNLINIYGFVSLRWVWVPSGKTFLRQWACKRPSKAMGTRDRKFSKHTQSSALSHTLLTLPCQGDRGAGCWKWGNKKGIDGRLVPNSLHSARHTDTSGFRVQLSSQTRSCFWRHRQQGNFSLGKQLLETLLARCWLLLAFVLQQLSQ